MPGPAKPPAREVPAPLPRAGPSAHARRPRAPACATFGSLEPGSQRPKAADGGATKWRDTEWFLRMSCGYGGRPPPLTSPILRWFRSNQDPKSTASSLFPHHALPPRPCHRRVATRFPGACEPAVASPRSRCPGSRRDRAIRSRGRGRCCSSDLPGFFP